ncbi:MAG: hypothetical protein QXO51_03600 [Halobacteria archaeon]
MTDPQKRRRPPSYHRYMAANPTVTLHLPKELKERLDQWKGGRSYGEVVRALLTNYEAAVQQRVAEARRSFEITYPCCICGQPLPLRPGSQEALAAVEHLRQAGWGHAACHERRQQSGFG